MAIFDDDVIAGSEVLPILRRTVQGYGIKLVGVACVQRIDGFQLGGADDRLRLVAALAGSDDLGEREGDLVRGPDADLVDRRIGGDREPECVDRVAVADPAGVALQTVGERGIFGPLIDVDDLDGAAAHSPGHVQLSHPHLVVLL